MVSNFNRSSEIIIEIKNKLLFFLFITTNESIKSTNKAISILRGLVGWLKPLFDF